MHHESYTTLSTVRPRSGVLTLSGYGTRVAVERGHLIVEDGRGTDRRQGRFPRTTRDLKRLIVIGHTGTISFDALRWLHDIGCAFVQIDNDGQVISASGPVGLDDARLRRAQALAYGNEAGVEIARDLLRRKLDGQAAVVEQLPDTDHAAIAIRTYRDELDATNTLIGLRICESQAASIYWGSWADVPVRFARKVAAKMPDHWQTFGTRSSPLTGSPRTAANPANAITNYLYAILEAETRIALLAIGLDPGLGIVHADQKNRDSFACDVMEAIRPKVDAFVLELLRTRPFGTGDFFERRDGCCRLMPPVTKMLTETAPRWAAELGSIVEGIAEALMHADGQLQTSAANRRLPTPLTQLNRSAGRAKMRRKERQPETPPSMKVPAACFDCGTILDDAARRYCDDCLPDVRKEQGITFAVAGPAALARRRAAGTDPAHGGRAGKSRGHRNASHHHNNAKWNQDNSNSQDADDFTREILPLLQGIPLSRMAKATGLTEGYCSFVRRGLKVPHRRHWSVLADVGSQDSD